MSFNLYIIVLEEKEDFSLKSSQIKCCKPLTLRIRSFLFSRRLESISSAALLSGHAKGDMQ